jgi:hypothetical protein
VKRKELPKKRECKPVITKLEKEKETNFQKDPVSIVEQKLI